MADQDDVAPGPVVAPDFATGLTHAELDKVEAWLDDPG